MEKENWVSLWLGHFPNEDQLETLMEEDYESDSDDANSPFAIAFHIDFFDEDFREAMVHDQASAELSRLLADASYHDVIISRFSQQLGATLDRPYNAVVLLYNFAYAGQVKSWQDGESNLYYMGSVNYSQS